MTQLSPAACDPICLWAEYAVWGYRLNNCGFCEDWGIEDFCE